MRANRESLCVVEALSSEDSNDDDDDDAATFARRSPATGFWTPKQVHEAVSASGPKLETFSVDVRARGACGALTQQLTSPVVRVRRLDVRAGAAALAAEDKKRLFAAVAAFSRVSEEPSDTRGLRRLTLASCGLNAEDAEALVAALEAGDAGDSRPEESADVESAERSSLESLESLENVQVVSRKPPFELDVAENPALGCAGAAALARLVARGRIHTLRMENCGVSEAGARARGDALASPKCALVVADVSRNFLGAGGVAAAANGLRARRGGGRGAARGAAPWSQRVRVRGCGGARARLARLRRVRATRNAGRARQRDGAGGIAALARGVLSARGAPRLRELRLQGNPLGAAGARAGTRVAGAFGRRRRRLDGDDGDDHVPIRGDRQADSGEGEDEARRATHESPARLGSGLGEARRGGRRRRRVGDAPRARRRAPPRVRAGPVRERRGRVRRGAPGERARRRARASRRDGPCRRRPETGRRSATAEDGPPRRAPSARERRGRRGRRGRRECLERAGVAGARPGGGARALRRLDLGYNSLGARGRARRRRRPRRRGARRMRAARWRWTCGATP